MTRYTTLIQPQELATRLGDPACLIVDCRFDIAAPEAGRLAYRTSHLPGAVFAHLDEDLSGAVTPDTGRHPLPDVAQFAATLGLWGIGEGTQVIAYDQVNGAIAARLWWMLRWLGHSSVAVLDGGFAAWAGAGLPLDQETHAPAPRVFRPRERAGACLTTAEVQAGLGHGSLTLIDARAADRFAGYNETLDPVAGHVPGARNHPFASNLDARGRFLPGEELRRRWVATLQGANPAHAACMCGSGVTACHNLLALEIAGMPEARLYAGSWSEWIRDPLRPVATGAHRRSE